MYRKKVLSNAVALSLGLSAAGVVGVAHADADLLFPYVVSGDNVTTVLSIVNTNQNPFDVDTGLGVAPTIYPLRIALNYKLGQEFANDAFCNHYDGFFISSINDLTSFDVSGIFGEFGVGAMFNDTVGAAAGGTLTDDGFLDDIANFPSFRGYVSIWDRHSDTSARTLEGDALVIDFNSGAAWGYRGLSRGDDPTDAAVGDVSWFQNLSNATYDVYPNGFNAAGLGLQIPFMPLADVQTRFFITVLNDDVIAQRDGFPGAVRAQMGGGSGPTLFNRLEQARSLNVSVNINCLGVVDIEDFLAGAATSPFVAQGGFSALNLTDANPGGMGLVDGILSHVIKLEFGKTNQLDGVSTGGTYNNAYQLNYVTDALGINPDAGPIPGWSVADRVSS